MKKNKFFLGAIFGLFTFLGIAMAANFSDIAGHWAESNLTWAVNNGLLKGDDVAEGQTKTLRPNDGVTRAEMVTILKRYDELRNDTGNTGISDNETEAFTTKIEGITWIGRESVNGEETVYEAVKIDALGNESVVYKTILTPYSDVQWNFSNDGKDLVIKAISAAVDAADYTEIGFIGGEETIRSHYTTYESGLTFELPDSPTYTVTLVTSSPCEGIISDSGDSQLTAPKTELSGVKISSEDGSQMFDLTEPEMVSCATGDGVFEDHRPQNVVISPYGISFHLPNGDGVWVSTAEGAQKIKMVFEPADSNYYN